MKHTILGLAVLLAVIWITARLVLAVSGAFLHLLWVAALILFVIWVFGLMTGRSRG